MIDTERHMQALKTIARECEAELISGWGNAAIDAAEHMRTLQAENNNACGCRVVDGGVTEECDWHWEAKRSDAKSITVLTIERDKLKTENEKLKEEYEWLEKKYFAASNECHRLKRAAIELRPMSSPSA